MFFSYDNYQNMHDPEVYLAYRDKRVICALPAHELKISPRLNSISSGSLKIYKYENGQPVDYYDKIEIGLLIEVRHVSWFQITEILLEKTNDGNEYLELTFQSLEIQLGQTYLTSFGSLGTDYDEQGGLDRYCLYNVHDPEHSIMHIFHKKNPGWSIGYVDPDISAQSRSFNADSITSYEFLVNEVSKTYECIFQFDVYERSVNAYKLENIGEKTPIFLSDRNLIESLSVKSDDSDIKTVFIVSGGNDSRTNTTLGINEVNPSGNNYISDFSYFYGQMTEELVSALKEYNKQVESNSGEFAKAIKKRDDLYTELDTLRHNAPENHDTTDFTQYGLAELEEKRDTYKGVMSLYINNTKHPSYSSNQILYEKVEAEITVRKKQITEKEAEIENQIALCKTFMVNIEDFLGDKLYQELSHYVREQDFQDDTFVATAEMTQAEIYEVQKELMAHAHSELEKVCYPQFEMSINVLNFTVLEDFRKYADKLELGNIITVEWEPGIIIEARILGMDIDYDNPENFTLLISSKNSLDEKWALLDEIRNQASGTATSVSYNKGAWNIAKDTSLDFRQWINNIFDASLQKLQNSSNQEVLIDETGIILRKWFVDQNKYSPNQVWMTNGQIAFTCDNWKSVCTALGEITLPDKQKVYGLAGQYIVGEIFAGETLKLSGSGAELNLEANNSITGLNTKFNIHNGLFDVYIGHVNEDGTINEENGKIFTRFTQTDNAISLKVSKDGIINAITVSPETIRIQGNRINLDGEVTFSNSNKFGIDGNTVNITNIDGGNIRTNSITSTQIAAGTITAKEIAAGTITSNKIKAGTITAAEISSDYVYTGEIDADQIKTGGIIKGVAIVFKDKSGGSGQCYWTAGANSLGAHGVWFCDDNAMGSGNRDILLWHDSGTLQARIGDFSDWCYAPDWTNGSDIRIKQDIHYEVNDKFEKIIDNLKPVSYRMVEDQKQTLRFGFIAQDVKTMIKELYGENESPLYRYNSKKDLYALSYNDIIAPLVVKVQSLQQQISQLQHQLNNL